MHDAATARPKLSIVLVTYQMLREAGRTLATLSESYQRDSKGQFEVIVIDNGSRNPITPDLAVPYGSHIRVLSMPDPKPSPAAALNYGRAQARGDIFVGMIDGARMLSPGCVAGTLRAFRAFADPVVIVTSWHLGPNVQNKSIRYGYCQAVEDRLLEQVDWQVDGYKLFDLCEQPDPSSKDALSLGTVAESNYIAVTMATFDRLKGFDESFASPGGGAVNLDFFRRAAESGLDVVTLLGEGTFHQFHGGHTTNVPQSEHPWPAISAEYTKVTGRSYAVPSYNPFFIGALSPQERDLLARNAASFPFKLTRSLRRRPRRPFPTRLWRKFW